MSYVITLIIIITIIILKKVNKMMVIITNTAPVSRSVSHDKCEEEFEKHMHHLR